MGLDLKLLVAYDKSYIVDGLVDTIRLTRDVDIINPLYELCETSGVKIKDTLSIGIKNTSIKYDNYGGAIKYLFSQDVKPMFKTYKPTHWRNKAIKRYILAMPSNVKIYLLWG